MVLTPEQIKEALSPLRDCRFIPVQSKTHGEKLEVLEITKIFKELTDTHGYEKVKKAVDAFSSGKNRANNIYNKPLYFRKTISTMIDEIEEIEANDSIINDDDYVIRKYDHYCYSLSYLMSQVDWDKDEYPPKAASFKADAYSKNEATLARLRAENLLSDKQVEMLRNRWNEFNKEEFEALEWVNTLGNKPLTEEQAEKLRKLREDCQLKETEYLANE